MTTPKSDCICWIYKIILVGVHW